MQLGSVMRSHNALKGLVPGRSARTGHPRWILGALALLVPACAAEPPEDVSSVDSALEAAWGEIDEDATPIGESEHAQALAIDEDDDTTPAAAFAETNGATLAPDDGADVDMPGIAAAAAPARVRYERPAACDAARSLDLNVYYELSSVDLLVALEKHVNACAIVTLSVPKVGGSPTVPDAQLWPRKLNTANLTKFGPQLRASAEVHWGASRGPDGKKYPGWKTVEVVKENGKLVTHVAPKARWFKTNWYLKGVLFRQRMAKRGYRPQAGDIWHINELESGWARTRPAQKSIRDLVRGLADGDPDYDAFTDTDPAVTTLSAAEKTEINVAARMKRVRGTIYISSLGRRLPTDASDDVWMKAVEQTLRRKKFWADMTDNVSYWGEERYLAGHVFCHAGQSLSAQTDAMGQAIMNLPVIAARVPRYTGGARAGQSPVATAMSFLSRTYDPIITSAWTLANEGLNPSQMKQLVSAQIYATRAWANDHTTPDGRIGIYFRPRSKDGVVPKSYEADNAALAERAAVALTGAYDGKKGLAIGACGPNGAEGCTCGD